jgi:DNA-binding response OmpR family regulator
MSQNVSSNAIEVYVHRLRHILTDAGANVAIHTIRGVGYLMDEEKDGPTKRAQ